MRSRLALSLLALAGCHATPLARQVTGPDGSPAWFHVSCPGNAGACYALAGERCPAGYTLEDREEHEDATGNAYANRSFAGAKVGVERSYEMLIRCKGRPAPCPPVDPYCFGSQPIPSSCDEQIAARRAVAGCGDGQ